MMLIISSMRFKYLPLLCLQALEKDDVDGDGALSYPEFMAGRRRGETVL
jgi:hypothetical protein